MSRQDFCHNQVIRALQKDGWVVDDRQFRLRLPSRLIFIDIHATKNSNGHRENVLLAEVKCFPESQADTTDLYQALGQYILYRSVLAESEISIPLYLAIPDTIYQTVFDSSARRAVQENRIKLLIVNLETERISQWIN